MGESAPCLKKIIPILMNANQNDNNQTKDEDREEFFELTIEPESEEAKEMAEALGKLIAEKGELDGIRLQDKD